MPPRPEATSPAAAPRRHDATPHRRATRPRRRSSRRSPLPRAAHAATGRRPPGTARVVRRRIWAAVLGAVSRRWISGRLVSGAAAGSRCAHRRPAPSAAGSRAGRSQARAAGFPSPAFLASAPCTAASPACVLPPVPAHGGATVVLDLILAAVRCSVVACLLRAQHLVPRLNQCNADGMAREIESLLSRLRYNR